VFAALRELASGCSSEKAGVSQYRVVNQKER